MFSLPKLQWLRAKSKLIFRAEENLQSAIFFNLHLWINQMLDARHPHELNMTEHATE